MPNYFLIDIQSRDNRADISNNNNFLSDDSMESSDEEELAEPPQKKMKLSFIIWEEKKVHLRVKSLHSL